jgi:hypothetical protein
VVERSIVNASPVPNKEKNPFNEPAQQADNFGGLFATASGTENYLVSPSAPPDEYVYIIPECAPLPEVEMQKQNLGRNMELATNPTENK